MGEPQAGKKGRRGCGAGSQCLKKFTGVVLDSPGTLVTEATQHRTKFVVSPDGHSHNPVGRSP